MRHQAVVWLGLRRHSDEQGTRSLIYIRKLKDILTNRGEKPDLRKKA